MEVNGIINTGFCGALDPALRVGDIVVSATFTLPREPLTAREIEFLRSTVVAVTSAEKSAVARKDRRHRRSRWKRPRCKKIAPEWGVPFYCIRAVSDAAAEDMPLDFNLYRDADGRFSRCRIALAATGASVSRAFRLCDA